MRKYLLLFTFSALSFCAFCQFEATKFVLGVSVSYGTNEISGTSNGGTNYNFGVAPSLAKVISSNALLGMELSYGYTKSGPSNDYFIHNSYSLGLYYQPFHTITEKIFFNWVGLARMGNSKTELRSEFSESESRQLNFSIRATPGLSWQVMDRLLLNATIGGASLGKSILTSGNPDSEAWSFNLSFNHPSFSFTYLLK